MVRDYKGDRHIPRSARDEAKNIRRRAAPVEARRREGNLGCDLVNAQPRSDGYEFDEGEVVGGEFVESSHDGPILLDPIEEPFDLVANSIEIAPETDRLSTIAFRRNVCRSALLSYELSDSVGIISEIDQQHRLWPQCPQRRAEQS